MRKDAPGLYRLGVMGPWIVAATSYRAGASVLGVWSRKAPRLANLWLDAIEPGGEQVAYASRFRDEVLKVNQEATERIAHEIDRGAKDLDRLTKPR